METNNWKEKRKVFEKKKGVRNIISPRRGGGREREEREEGGESDRLMIIIQTQYTRKEERRETHKYTKEERSVSHIRSCRYASRGRVRGVVDKVSTTSARTNVRQVSKVQKKV